MYTLGIFGGSLSGFSYLWWQAPTLEQMEASKEQTRKTWWEQVRAENLRRRERRKNQMIQQGIYAEDGDSKPVRSKSVIRREFPDLRGKALKRASRRQPVEVANSDALGELDPETFDSARATGIRADSPPLGASVLWRRFVHRREDVTGAPATGRVTTTWAKELLVAVFELRDEKTGKSVLHVVRRSAANGLEENVGAEDGATATPSWSRSNLVVPSLPQQLKRRMDTRREQVLKAAKRKDARMQGCPNPTQGCKYKVANHGEFIEEAAAAGAFEGSDSSLSEADRDALLYVKEHGGSHHTTPILHYHEELDVLHLFYVVVKPTAPACATEAATARAAARTRGGAVFVITSSDRGRSWTYPPRSLQDDTLWMQGLGALNDGIRLGASMLVQPPTRRGGHDKLPETWMLPFVRDADTCTNTEAYSSIGTLYSEDKGSSWRILNPPPATDLERGAGKPGSGMHFTDPQLLEVTIPLLGTGLTQNWILGLYRGTAPVTNREKRSVAAPSALPSPPSTQAEVHAHLYWSKSYDNGRQWEPSNRVSIENVPYSLRDLGFMGGSPFFALTSRVGYGDAASDVLLIAHNDHAGGSTLCEQCRTRLRLSAVRDIGIGMRDASREFGTLGHGAMGTPGAGGPFVQSQLVQLEARREAGLRIDHPIMVHAAKRLPNGRMDAPQDSSGCIRVLVLYSVAYNRTESVFVQEGDHGKGALNARFGRAHEDLEQVWLAEPEGIKEALVKVCDTPEYVQNG